MPAQQRMARTVLAIVLSLAHAVVATTPGGRTASTMSVDDALLRLSGKLSPQIVELVRGGREQRASRKTGSFLGMSVRGVTGAVVDKKNVEFAREMLNKMMEETQEKYDREDVSCEATIHNEEVVIEETSLDISQYNSQATAAKGDHIRAETAMNQLSATSGKLEVELAQSRTDCRDEIAALKGEIAIMNNDSAVLQRIVGMIKCPKKAGFVQCNDSQGNTTTFEEPELQTEMARVQSGKAKGLLKSALTLGYETGATRAAFVQFKHQEPEMGAPVPGCTLASNPNCGKLLDKFLEISGELDSDIMKFEEHLEKKEFECQTEHENYETQISDLTSRLENWQTALSEATDRAIQASQGERLKSAQREELYEQHDDTMSSCHANLATFTSEKCALGKIRGELYSMSSVPIHSRLRGGGVAQRRVFKALHGW